MHIPALPLCLALFAVSASAAKWEYIDCGLKENVLQLESLTISPDPPVPGKDLTITAKGYARESIEDGAYADVTVKLGLIKLLSKTFDICEEARKANVSISCPVAEGKYVVVQTVVLPKEIPPAKFIVQVRAYTVDDDDMLCLDLEVDFLPRN
ncbi:MD-2-related lipid-recognition domain-containing protein [Mycena latifolia]|nr:MD-2-related lipid-recognition domain-containing protein [Mycena latifolia]